MREKERERERERERKKERKSQQTKERIAEMLTAAEQCACLHMNGCKIHGASVHLLAASINYCVFFRVSG